MDKLHIINKVEELISEAKKGKAIDTLQAFLRKDSNKYQQLYRRSLEIEAMLKRAQREERQGIISFENARLIYNQVTNHLLNLLEDVRADRLEPTGASLNQKKLPWAKILAITLPSLLVIGVLIYFFLIRHEHEPATTPAIEPKKITCPDFDTLSMGVFRILILPFFNPSEDNPTRAHLVMKERLNTFKREEGLNLSIATHEDFDPQIRGLMDFAEAAKVAQKCGAKMIIWGRAEQGNESSVVKTRFKYLGGQANLELNRLQWEGESEVANLKTLSSIATQGELTRNIEQAILMAMGLIAHQEGNHDLVVKSLKGLQIAPEDSATHLMKNMLLADSYLEIKQGKAAVAALDTALDLHPNYWLALNNRGVLLMEQEAYIEATEDFSNALKIGKDSANLLTARGTAYLRSNQLSHAKTDLEKARILKPDLPGLDTKINTIEKGIRKEKRTLKKAEADLRSNPKNTKALVAKASAAQKLDLKSVTQEATQQLVEVAPKDPIVYASLVEHYLLEKQPIKAQATLKEAEARGINREAIFAKKEGLKKNYEVAVRRAQE